MISQEMQLIANIQEALRIGADISVQVAENNASLTWFGQICFHRSPNDVDKAYFVVLYQSQDIYETEDAARLNTQAILNDLKNRTFDGLTLTTFFRPALISAGLTVLTLKAFLTLIIEKRYSQEQAEQTVKENLERCRRTPNCTITVQELVKTY